MKLKSICVAAAIACATTGAHAASFGELSAPAESFVGLYTKPLFADSISFSLAAPSTVYIDPDIVGGAGGFGLFSGTTLIGSLYSLESSTVSFSGLSTGDYKLGFFGFGGGVTAVSFAANAIAAPVPEPETYAMLLAGLGMIGAIARRRRV
ncbi:FxDxF family PEP-CTERM protein [Niveibacterium sp. 24ML]|uniref:FxDxF family PEP-CTERM protein n=1 Tax=Niveibacterium sp. 24ML TaxID=2985512 RepID=UPI002271B146|nr:FxDxF family PEP-CTERM protein [Niveibacterium sp. 24ML]MCX9158305.1 FxDxF family PEP-CTERM protein [Niveibacterium sp. 24ML]